MWILWPYLIGLFVLPIIFGFFNRYHKWVTQKDLKKNDNAMGAVLFIGIFLWPAAICVFAIIFGIVFFVEFFIPKDRDNKPNSNGK